MANRKCKLCSKIFKEGPSIRAHFIKAHRKKDWEALSKITREHVTQKSNYKSKAKRKRTMPLGENKKPATIGKIGQPQIKGSVIVLPVELHIPVTLGIPTIQQPE